MFGKNGEKTKEGQKMQKICKNVEKRISGLLRGLILFFVISFLLAIPAISQQTMDKDTLLLCSFEDNPNSADGKAAKVSKGIEYVEGKFGKGAYFKGSSYIRYPAEGNINPDNGTIEMWIKPLWDGNDGKIHHILSAIFESKTQIFMYKWFNGNLSVHIYGEEKGLQVLALNVNNWKSGEWHHIATTWQTRGDQNEVCFYVDRKLITSRKNLRMPVGEATLILLGTAQSKKLLDAVVDEFCISKVARPISSEVY